MEPEVDDELDVCACVTGTHTDSSISKHPARSEQDDCLILVCRPYKISLLYLQQLWKSKININQLNRRLNLYSSLKNHAKNCCNTLTDRTVHNLDICANE